MPFRERPTTITVHPCHERNLLCLIGNQMASCSCLCCSSRRSIIGSPNGKGLYFITVIRHLRHTTTVMSSLEANAPFMNNSCSTLVMLCVFTVLSSWRSQAFTCKSGQIKTHTSSPVYGTMQCKILKSAQRLQTLCIIHLKQAYFQDKCKVQSEA